MRIGNALFLSTTDGRRIKVYGGASQLIAAPQILLERLLNALMTTTKLLDSER